MEYRCVQCGFSIKTLYIQYSPGNIRLMKCEKCKSVADEYIECEIMILLIDLILHKTKAYRHLLFNVRKLETLKFEELFWKLAVGYLLLDAFIQGKSLILESSKGESGSSKSFSSLLSLSTCWKTLMDVFFGNFMFLLTFLSVVRIFIRTSIKTPRCKDFFLAILISSYFKIFLIAMLVWEFPTSVIFIIDLFVLSSNIAALKGMLMLHDSWALTSFSSWKIVYLGYSLLHFNNDYSTCYQEPASVRMQRSFLSPRYPNSQYWGIL